ncbi:hypothetical protein [uncultured Anaerococcus sp.]|uniref:hypothetical protein n=1 Tax=uncultured Anaerococcus sp. TaxID=293428 RepID=UPI0025F513A4|nr:hypothetical protein [uncultured Anaerococcus sp.]
MKNTNKCPKCGSSEIIKVPGHAGAYGSGNNIMVGITIKSAVPVDKYLCTIVDILKNGLILIILKESRKNLKINKYFKGTFVDVSFFSLKIFQYKLYYKVGMKLKLFFIVKEI